MKFLIILLILLGGCTAERVIFISKYTAICHGVTKHSRYINDYMITEYTVDWFIPERNIDVFEIYYTNPPNKGDKDVIKLDL